MTNAALGAGGAVVAALFWGSNFVVTKNFTFGDGLIFQFLLCSGILFFGILTLLSGSAGVGPGDYDALFSLYPFVGGVFWACGNVVTVPIVNRVGLGIGLSIWGGSSNIVSFIVGQLGLFGIKPEALTAPWLGYVGILLGAAGLVTFSFIKPDLGTSEEEDGFTKIDDLADKFLESGDEEGIKSSSDKSEFQTRMTGIALALFAGLMYGFQFVPMTLWQNSHQRDDSTSQIIYSIRLFFSQFAGIFMTSTVFLVFYSLFYKTPDPIESKAIPYSIISGLVWATAACGSMIASSPDTLGLTVGYVLSTNGAFITNAIWTVVIFREVRDGPSLRLFALAIFFVLSGCVCLILSKS